MVEVKAAKQSKLSRGKEDKDSVIEKNRELAVDKPATASSKQSRETRHLSPTAVAATEGDAGLKKNKDPSTDKVGVSITPGRRAKKQKNIIVQGRTPCYIVSWHVGQFSVYNRKYA